MDKYYNLPELERETAILRRLIFCIEADIEAEKQENIKNNGKNQQLNCKRK